MGFVALIFALLIEQGRPLPERNPVHRGFAWLADAVMNGTNAGERRHGVAGWFAIAAGSVGAVWLAQWLLAQLHPLALFCLHVVVLYLTLGFRQFSHAFSEIQAALIKNDLETAKGFLETWLRRSDPQFNAPRGAGPAERSEICRLAISHAMIDSHRFVLAPLLWYVLLPGFVGPVLYRCAEYLSRDWASPNTSSPIPAGCGTGTADAWSAPRARSAR